MKKVLKWIAIVVLLPVVLVAMLAGALYIPAVQNWAVQKVARVASEKTGMDITVEHVHLAFPLDLSVEGLRVLKQNDSLPQQRDTVADVRRLVVDVQLLPLFKNRVEIDALDFHDMRFNTTDFVKEARVKGSAGRLSLQSHGIDLKAETMRIDDALLADADVHVVLNDSVPEDTTESENRWKILVDRLNIERSQVNLTMPGDTTRAYINIGKMAADSGAFDLAKSDYRISHLNWSDGQLAYDNRFAPRQPGLDYNHLSVTDIQIDADSLCYKSGQSDASSPVSHPSSPSSSVSSNADSIRTTPFQLSLNLKKASLKEKCGLQIDELSGHVKLDEKQLQLPDLRLRTPESSIDAQVAMDMNTFGEQHPGEMNITTNASVGKQDIVKILGSSGVQEFRSSDITSRMLARWPNQPLTVKGVVRGNMKQLRLVGVNAKLPSAFDINASGTIANLDRPDLLKADVNLDAKAHDVGFISQMVPPETMGGVRIPKGIALKGNVKADGARYTADVTATEGGGTLKLKGSVDTQTMAYNADVKANNLQIKHFLPNMDMTAFSGNLQLKGAGTDFLSPRAKLDATVDISKFGFGQYNLDGIKGKANIANGKIHADINADNPLLKGLINVDALTSTIQSYSTQRSQRKSPVVRGTVSADLQHADLYSLHLTDEPLTISGCGHFDLATDFNDFYQVQGFASDLTITNGNVYRPGDISLDLLTRRDTTHAVVQSGDFSLNLNASGGYKKLLNVGNNLLDEAKRQTAERRIDQMALRQLFPNAHISLRSGRDNLFSKMLEDMGYTFQDARIRMETSPADGLNGNIELLTLMVDSMQLDTVRVNFVSDSTNITFNGQIRNNTKNPQFVFNTLFDGRLIERGANVNLRYYDAADKLGVRLGAEAAMEQNGIRLHLDDKDAVIAYRPARINADNYVFLADNQRISANLDILADDGTGLKVYSNDDNLEALQDLTLSLNKLDLQEITSVIPYLPDITGLVNGDYHYVQDEEHFTVSSAMNIEKLTYEGNYMGNLGTEFVYMPLDDGSHFVDGTLEVEGQEVGTINGTYNADRKDAIDAVLSLNRLPISLVNGFIPDQLFGFKGYGEGDINIKGTLERPKVDGEVFLDSCHLVSVPYGLDMRFSNDPVRIVGSHLLLENFEMYAYNENPLNMAGDIDFSNLDDVRMNVRMRAENFKLIDAKENNRSVAFGEAFVNFFGRMDGPLNNLKLRGKLDVLGTSDVNYILRDSPLTTDNQLDGLVKFTDFTDTTQTVVNRPPLNGFSMDMTVDVSKGAHVMAYLNADKTNYIALMGGGTLRMMYNTADDLRLTGRYTLSNGEMKYSLPVIPLKTFTIQDGSYIEFTGDPMNPTLNITATEEVKATVSGDNGVGRSVYFDCGVIITKTLNDMGLEFTLDAPQDMQLHGELQTMSVEQRGKLAVTMLTTGMYLADGNTNGFSMNSALNSFLQSEINQITGNALRTLDFSVGLDNTTDATGNMHTDYSFKFAKRFWNNRLKIAIGGKVSTGSDIPNQNQSFFDNVTFEYRLDDTANKYVKLFYENNVYDWLDGYTQEYGVGFIWRRSLQHFKDIFNLKSEQPYAPLRPVAPQDSLHSAPSDTTITHHPSPTTHE